MDLQLNGRRALVTGASAGTGTAIATTLAREGVRVVVHGRDPDRTDAVCRSIRDAGYINGTNIRIDGGSDITVPL